MKKAPPLLIRYVLLLLSCSLQGSLSNRDVNDLIQTSSRLSQSTQYTPHASSPHDLDLRRTPAAATHQWSSDSHKTDYEKDSSTPRNQGKVEDEGEEVGKLGDQTRIQDDSIQQINLENGEDEASERLSQTTSVHTPTYFSYSTTRRANSRDRVNGTSNPNRNLKGRRNEGGNYSQNSTRLENGRRNGRNSSTIVINDNRDDVIDETSTSIVDDEDSTRITSRKNSYKTNSRGYGYTQTDAITSSQPTMTYSSDILKVISPKLSTFGRRVNSTDENSYTTKLLPSDQVPTSRTTIRYRTTTTTDASPRDSRILTGRRKVNREESTTDSDKYLERIQEQITLSSSTGSQSYHDASKNSEYKKKPLKKDTEAESVIIVGGKQNHMKESAKMKEPSDITQKTTESWDERYKRLKESGKLKESVTQKPTEVLEDKYSTIIDSLSKGSGNIPQNIIIESQKNVTINNEPGTNLLDTVESKETNEKRETKAKEDDESKNGGDVIPVIIKNSVVGEGVSEVLNKTNSFRLSGDVRPNNESLFSSGNSGVNVGERKELSDSSENLENSDRKKLPDVVEENQEIKKKIHSLKKPTSGGKVDDGFDDNSSSAVPTLELNRTTIGGESGGDKNEEENKIKKINELQKTRIISSTSRITSSSSSRLGSIIQHEYTTYASNNLENNILTTSSPMFHGFTSTTPRINHHFSLKTTTEQSQPAENFIKQIPSFYPRKTSHESSTSSVLITEKTPDDHSREVAAEHSRKTYSTDGTRYSKPGHPLSSTMRSSPVRKIVPWSTRLQKTTHMPETTMMDYSDGTVTTSSTKPSSTKEMSILFPVWSPTTQRTKSDGSTTDRTSQTTFGIPTATFITSETPSSNTWSPLGYSSRVTSRFVDETSPTAPTSSTSRLLQSSKTSVDASVYPDATTVPTLSLSITTTESPTQVDSIEFANKNSTQNISTSKSSSSNWETTDSSSDEHISTSAPSSKITNTWETTLSTGNSSNVLQSNITSESSLETSSPHPSSDDENLETTRTFFESTNWSTYEDGKSTEDLQFGDGDLRWKSTTSANSERNSTEKEMTTVSGYGSEDEIGSTSFGDFTTTLRPEITSKSLENSTSRGGFDGVTPSRSYPTSNSAHHASSNSISKQNSTSKPQDSLQNSTLKPQDPHQNSTSESQDSHQNSTLKPQDSHQNSTSKPQYSHQNLTSKPQDSHQNSTSKSQDFLQNSTSKPRDSHQNSTSKPQDYHQNSISFLSNNRTTTIKTPTHDTEDFFETDEEEVHTTTPISTEGEFEQGNEEEDDKSISNAPTSVTPNKDNRINRNESVSDAEITTERNNFVMKISTTDSPMSTHPWITDSKEEGSTTVPIRVNDSSTTTVPTRVDIARPTWPVRPVTSEPDPATTNPQYMGLSLLIKGSTLQEICEAQQSLKRAIIFLFRNTTGRVLDEDQIDFPSLTADECKGARALKSGLHSIDLILYDENGNFDDQLNSEFRMLWENNGLRTNIAIHDVYLVLRPSEDVQTSGMTIAVIVIACIGLTCMLLFFILMMILRKRQNKFSYGQRCTPVSLDDYSLDNISVYNSIRRKNARRASKRSYGNPAFDDPSAPSHQINFAALAHLSGNRKAMDDEFDAIPMIAAKMDELPPGAETRNRYANVIPLPETRVHLKVREGDDPVNSYINANYVKGPKGVDKFYIACQAPMQSTVNDFWRMIWEQQSKLILMLTDLHENGVEKCFDYLPPSEVLDCHRLFGDYQVTLKKREVREKYVISHLQLKNLDSNLWREVTHLWYTSWPHQGTPSEGASIIAYLIEARAFTRNSAGPHVVHCSPGVGRTGTVLAIDLCIREFETSRLVDVPKTVYGLRRNRAGCVQTKDQYAFIYMVLNVYGTKLTGGALDSM